MLSNPQKAMVKRAQKEAGLDDGDYRDALQTVCGCRSATDPRMTDRDFDVFLAYAEAIYWRKVDLGQLQSHCKTNSVFQHRGYWASKNPGQETSRDRFQKSTVASEIERIEAELAKLGLGAHYCAGIRRNVIQDSSDAHSLHKYKAALARTLAAKQRASEKEANPF